VTHPVQVDITTDKGVKIFPFSYLSINQRFDGHHSFELRFNHDVLEQPNSVIINKSKDFLGASITFSLKKEKGEYPDNVFKAIITDVGIANNIKSAGDIIFKGYSPTILLEHGKHNASFAQKNLEQIVKAAMGKPSNLLNVTVNPKFKSSIPFIMQYRETAFDFVRRLAGEYGEWFFFDGSNLNFGKPSNQPNIELKYPSDIHDLNLNVRVAPLKFNQVEYNSKDNEKFTSDSGSQQVSGLDSFGSHAMTASNSLFTNQVSLLSEKDVASKSDLDTIVKAEKSSRAADLVYLSASSDSPYVSLGAIAKISASKGGQNSDEDFGKYLVVNVTHSMDGSGNYSNTFSAIPSSVDIVPNPYDKAPDAEPQLGIVKQNNDPDNLGRVKVQLLWQQGQDTTPWIRVMSLSSGTRSGGDKNRGLFFTPEVDDYVVVGFTQNDPNRPFVMGSVPHGKAIDTSKNSDNHIKAITTRSGSTVYFKDKDDDKEQEIIVKTDDKNIISISVKSGDGTVTINSSKDIVIQSDKTISVKSEKITIEASDTLSLKGQTVSIEASQSLKAKGQDATVEGTTGATLKSSAQVDVDAGSGIASVKGMLVKIN
jgi:type VI secretion system secreted protein VgrG